MAKKPPKKSGKKPPTKSPGSGAQKQEARRQRLEARRAAKAEAAARVLRQQRRERIVRAVVFALVAAVLVWFIFLRNAAPTEIAGHEIRQFSTAGVNNHSTDTVNYETSPPVSGEHAPGTLPCGVYNQQIPNETQVHMLEHGAVGIQYQPTVELDTIRSIEEIVGEFERNVFSAPYAEMDTPLSVTSWSRKMNLDSFDETAIREYIDEFAGKGPESGQECPSRSEAPFEPQPTASPSPETTDDGDDGGAENGGNNKKGNKKGRNNDDGTGAGDGDGDQG